MTNDTGVFMRIVSAAAIAALLIALVGTPAGAADGDPTLTITGVVAVTADGPNDGAASIVTGNTFVPVEPDAVAGLAPGTQVRAELTIPAQTLRDLRVTGDVAATTAKGEAIVEDATAPFAVESLTTLASDATPAGVHYLDIAVNTTHYSGAVLPTDAQILQAVSDASAYWVANTDGTFPGFVVRTLVHYSSTMSCSASDDRWFADAATRLGVNVDDYVATASGEHMILIGECSHDAKAALGTVGDSLDSGGLVLTQADAFSASRYLPYLGGLLVHELGHNFSLQHANGPALDGCGFSSVPAYTEIAYCDIEEYADPYSLMGYGMPISYAPLLDVARRDQLHVSDPTSLATQGIDQTDTYTLTALGASGGLKGVKVTTPSGTYYVENRTATGEPDAYYLDTGGCDGEWEPSPTCTEADGIVPEGPGVRVLALNDDGSTVVEAMHPQVQDAVFGEFGLDEGDWFVSAGQDLAISVDSVSGDTATVTITSGGMPKVSFGVPVLLYTPSIGTPVRAFAPNVPDGTTLTYRWFRNGLEIAGATGEYYTPVAADAGTTLSARVEGRAAGKSPTQRMAASAAVVQKVPKLASTPVVNLAVGVTLGSWPDGFAFTYQWLRGGVAIAGATSDTYTPAVADAGAGLSVRVTAAHPTWGTVTLRSATSTVAKGTMTAPTPTITGTAHVGATLTANRGVWPAGSTFTYRWSANGVALSGATAKTLKVPSSAAGKKVTVRVWGTPPGYNTATATSSSVGVPRVGKVTITGLVKANHTLTAHVGTWTSGTTFTYQWYVNGVAIPGATKYNYWLTSIRVGKTMTVRVVGSKPGFATAAATSAATSKVTR